MSASCSIAPLSRRSVSAGGRLSVVGPRLSWQAVTVGILSSLARILMLRLMQSKLQPPF